jgi:HD-GYP domain-containing protein (c-di-GMP phosphodiesterase class II)
MKQAATYSIYPGLLPFSLYLPREDGSLALYAKRGYFITEEQLERTRKKFDYFLIYPEEASQYVVYVRNNFQTIVRNQHIASPQKAEIIYAVGKEIAREVLDDPRGDAGIFETKNVIESSVEEIIKDHTIAANMLNLSSRDYYTYTHSVNVCTISLLIGKEILSNDPTRMKELGLGAMLHDIGKSEIDPKIINKPTRLTAEEFAIIKTHPEKGFKIALAHKEIAHSSRLVILQHQEKVDGTGYPLGFDGSRLHLYSKIVSVADVYDAMTTRRSYREGYNHKDALRIMVGMKGHFEWFILEKLIELVVKDSKLADSLKKAGGK